LRDDNVISIIDEVMYSLTLTSFITEGVLAEYTEKVDVMKNRIIRSRNERQARPVCPLFLYELFVFIIMRYKYSNWIFIP